MRRRRSAIASLVALALLASGTALYASRQRDVAQAQRDAAVANRLVAEADRLRETDASLAAQLDLAAYRANASPSAYTALVNAATAPLSTPLSGHDGAVASVAYHPGGGVLAGAGYDGTVRLWEVAAEGPPVILTEDPGGPHGEAVPGGVQSRRTCHGDSR